MFGFHSMITLHLMKFFIFCFPFFLLVPVPQRVSLEFQGNAIQVQFTCDVNNMVTQEMI